MKSFSYIFINSIRIEFSKLLLFALTGMPGIMKFLKIFLVIFFLKINLYSQTFYPEIENFTIEDYQADNQNWDIDVDDQGVVYVANNKGLLRYNGKIWSLYELPNSTIIRSVFCKGDIIYTGSYEEFGYWKRNKYGAYTYVSLIHLLQSDHQLVNEEFWEITEHEGLIYFRSFGGIYKFDGKQISFISGSQGVMDFEIYGEELLVSIRNAGIFKLDNENLATYSILKKVSDFNQISTISAFDSFLFLYDEEKGAFFKKGNSLSALPQEITLILDKAILNKAEFINQKEIAFGTIKNGVLLYNLDTKSYYSLENTSGLNNNTVLGLQYNAGELWAALDNGITSINLANSLYYFTDNTGTIGTVYDVCYFNKSYYLASNTGIYKFSKSGEFKFVEGSEGQAWNLKIINDELFAGHNNGLYKINDNAMESIDLTAGGVFEIKHISQTSNKYLLGTYSGITKLYQKQGEWRTQLISGINFPVKKIIFESPNILWVAHPYKGIFRIILSKDYSQAIKITDYSDRSKFEKYLTDPYRIDEQIIFQNAGKWYHYLPSSDSIETFTKFQKFQNKNLITREESGFWFVNKDEDTRIELVNDSLQIVFQLNSSEIQKRLVSGFEKIIIVNDSTRILNLNDGMVLIKNLDTYQNKAESSSKAPIIDKIITSRGLQEIKNNFSFPFNASRNITFQLYVPNNFTNTITYKLSGRLDQEGTLNNGSLRLQNLPYGNYAIYFNNQNAQTTVELKILPPWYWSVYAKFLYLLLITTFIYLLYKQNKLKIRKQQIALQRAYVRETQKRLAKKEKEKLEQEVLDKKRELTSSTASVIKKNEMIIELRNELNRLKDVSPNQYRTKRLLTLSKNYLGDDKDWKIFQSSFNDLHKDFFKKLLNSFPKLTTKDLKLCAYIKTGLTTKEIAPLMGITVRGVELHRYRLRKKLDLSTEDNFQNFLTVF